LLLRRGRVTFTGREGAKEWTFRAGRKVERLTVRSRVAVNTAEAVADAASAGIGITRLLCYQVSDAVLNGRLKLLLRKFEPAPLPVSLVSPDAKLVSQKLRRSASQGASDFSILGFRDWHIGVGTKRQISSTRWLYVSRLMAEISLPAALMRATASRVFSTTVAI